MSQSYNPNSDSRVSSVEPTGSSSSQIPDLLKIGAIPTDTTMDVLTDILDPVVQNDTFIRFAFQNKGILHSMSKIKFGFTNANQNSCLPINVGLYALIQRVRLTIGAKTVCEIDDFNQFMAYKGLFVSQEAMKEREQYLTSRIMAYGFEYKDNTIGPAAELQFGWAGSNPNNATETVGQMTPANTEAEFITLDNGWCPLVTSQQHSCDAGGIEQFMNKTATQGVATGDGYPIYKAGYWTNLKKSVARACPDFQVSIADLCPFLRTQQLPLYMMDELVQLEIFTSPPTDRLFCPGHDDGILTIDPTETQLIADYIYYPQEMMVAYANANRNLTFTYVDYRLSKFSVAGNTQTIPTTQLIRNIGGAGRIITRVFMGIQNRTNNLRMMNSRYRANAPERDYSNGATSIANVNGEATLNLKYNDTFLYPIDVNNNARHFHNTASAEGLTPYTTREVYSQEGQSLTGGSFQVASTVQSFTGPPGSAIVTDLSGSAFYVGWRLGDNQRINSRGIELYMTWSNSNASANGYLQRVWLETIKQLTLENGRVDIQFA
jgi:hypothetical protein